MNPVVSLALGAALLASTTGAMAQRAGPQPTKALTDEIATADNRSRRELVAGTLKVYPLDNYGAVEVGEHRFYKLTPGRPEQLVEVALFTQVWKKDPGGWKLARVLSYDHRLAETSK